MQNRLKKNCGRWREVLCKTILPNNTHFFLILFFISWFIDSIQLLLSLQLQKYKINKISWFCYKKIGKYKKNIKSYKAIHTKSIIIYTYLYISKYISMHTHVNLQNGGLLCLRHCAKYLYKLI